MSYQAPSTAAVALPTSAPVQSSKPAAALAQDIDDLALIERIIAGDVRAFELLMRRHNQKLYRAARSILLNDADAEEAVQEAWWKAYKHFKEFRGDAKPSTWLTRIAVNEALMRRRRNKSRSAVIQSVEPSLPGDDMPTIQIKAPPGVRPDERMHNLQLRHALEEQIDALPEIYRTAFMLCGVDQMSAKDAAKALGIRPVTVRVRYMRARRMLRSSLTKQLNIDSATAFSFAGARCDRIVEGVMDRLQAELNGSAVN